MRKFNIGDRVTMVTLPSSLHTQPPRGLTSYLVVGTETAGSYYYISLSGDADNRCWYNEKHFVLESRTYGRNYPAWW